MPEKNIKDPKKIDEHEHFAKKGVATNSQLEKEAETEKTTHNRAKDLNDPQASQHFHPSDSASYGRKDPLSEAQIPFGQDPTHLHIHGGEDVFSHSMMPKIVHWAMPWADIMMVMFILFAVMYSHHVSKTKALYKEGMFGKLEASLGSGSVMGHMGGRFGDSSGPVKESLDETYEWSQRTIRAYDLESIASVDLVKDKAERIILTGDLLFDTGKADLKPEAKKRLVQLSEIIGKTPYTVNVIGHTDNVPIWSERFPSNWELSAIRACTVARFLMEEMKIEAERFYISGHSFYQPIKDNDMPDNRATNRRVEIIITREKPLSILEKEAHISSPG